MRTFRCFVFASLLMGISFAQAPPPGPPQAVEIQSGNLRLRAVLWRPMGGGPFAAVLFNHGSGGPSAPQTAGMPITEAAQRLAPLFIRHGYAFLYPFRRGHGPSADQGPFIQDLLQREEATKGKEARQHLQFILLTTDYLQDVLAALAFLKSVPGIDSHRIVIAGHSFGGQLTLLAAERDKTVRAALAFGAAAAAWSGSAELRERLLTAVRKATAPIMLVQAENDYSTAPSRALGDELKRLDKPHLVKIYPSVGQSSDDGHNIVYGAIPQWEEDVFKFLDQYVMQ
jgi:carboxymethylenebutenolidase